MLALAERAVTMMSAWVSGEGVSPPVVCAIAGAASPKAMARTDTATRRSCARITQQIPGIGRTVPVSTASY